MLAVLCINLPTLRPYYLRFRAKYGSYWTSSCKNNNDENNNNYSNTGLGESHELSYPSKTTSSFAGAMAAMTTGKKNKNDDMGGSKYAAWIELVSRLCCLHVTLPGTSCPVQSSAESAP